MDCTGDSALNSDLGVSQVFPCSDLINKRELEDICEDVEMVELCLRIEESELFDTKYDNDLYQISVMVENSVSESSSHQKQTERGKVLKRSVIDLDANDAKRLRHEEASTSNYEVQCNKRDFAYKGENNTHKNSNIKPHDSTENVSVESAFEPHISYYKVMRQKPSGLDIRTPEQFLESVQNDILILIDEAKKQQSTIKINFLLRPEFTPETINMSNSFDLQLSNFTISQANDLNIFMSALRDKLTIIMSHIERNDNERLSTKNYCLDRKTTEIGPLSDSHIDLPKDIKDKKAVLNVKNSDNQSFKWALLSALYPVNKNKDRPSSYRDHTNKLNFNGVSFPIKLNDLSKVENQNNISVNVFGLEFDMKSKKHTVVGPLYLTKAIKSSHVNLLYIRNETNGHYCYIKNLSRLVSNQITKRNGAVFICNACLLRFTTEDKLNAHLQNCEHYHTTASHKIVITSKNAGIRVICDDLFVNKLHRTMESPYIIFYADLKVFLIPYAKDLSNPFTKIVHRDDHCSFGYYIKCEHLE